MDYVAFDLETTGLDPKKNKIIEIGAVKVVDGQITDTFQTFINPGWKLSEEVSKLTGIRQKDLENAPAIGDRIAEFLTFTENYVLLGHQVIFDFSFIKRAAVQAGLTFERNGVDTLKIARVLLPDLPSRSLTALCEHYSIPLVAHRALNDATATHELYQRLLAEYGEQEKIFESFPLIYKVKKEGPITKAQKERLYRLHELHNIEPEYNVESLTKNEASRIIDQIGSIYGIEKK